MRANVLRVIVVIAFFGVAGALFYMQIIKGSYYYAQSRSNRIRVIPVDAPRGLIVDNQGVVLADNRMAYHIAVIDQDTDDKDALFSFLGKILSKDPSALSKLFSRRRITPFTPVVIAEDVPASTVLKIEENRFQYPGLMVIQTFLRAYPKSPALSHVVGYVGKIESAMMSGDEYGVTPLSYIGKTGVEKSYDEQLRGSSGGRQIEINSRGQQVRTLSIKEPVEGDRVQLTIDSRLSVDIQETLGDRRGSVVVMDVSNGDIVAMVSSPSFNANAFVDKNINQQVTGFFKNPNAPMLNRAINGQYPPGSVFKIPVALAALQLNKILPSQTYDCPGYYMLGGRKFGCAHVHGREDLYQAIAHSCNVYFFHLGQQLGARVVQAYAKAFGLTKLTQIDLPFEAKGRLKKISGNANFFGGDTLNLSIGQGETLTTPIQITVMMGAVATDGYLLKPRIVRAIGDQEVEVQDIVKRPRVKLRPEVWQQVQEGMRDVVNDDEGTGRVLQEIKGVKIWGKTGTAQSGVGRNHHAWFAGYVESGSHRFAFCSFLEHGGSSANAVELTKNVLLSMQKLNIL